MVEDRLALLTDLQKQYLRLVHEGLTSKEIAQRLGGSYHTVNVQIATASRVLGARTRSEAAAMLMTAESYERSYEPEGIAERSISERFHDRGQATRLPLPIPTAGRPLNDLTTWQRLLWIIALAAIVALIAGGLVSGIVAQLDGLGRRI